MQSSNIQVVCFVQHEGEGEVTANIFTCCVAYYIETGCNREIILYNDGCESQNRNITISNALLQVAQEKDEHCDYAEVAREGAYTGGV